MKAAVRSRYGTPEVLTPGEVEKPVPKDAEVLVKVYATTVNRSDYHVLTGKPFFMRFFTGLVKPKLSVTGSDFAGEVEAMGRNTKTLKAGDKVMGFIDMGCRSHAEYLTIAESKVTRAPANASHQESVACLEGAFYALSAVQKMKPQRGQKAMVIGATGAIGSSAVQFLKYFGVEVTAVCRKENSALVKTLGAKKVIDYKSEDFTADEERYDLVFDAVGKYSFAHCRRLLRDKAIFTSSAGLENIFLALITSLSAGKRVIFPVPENLMSNLSFIRDLVESGNFRPVIDKKYTLDQIAEAYRYVGSGEKIGSVIISIRRESIDQS